MSVPNPPQSYAATLGIGKESMFKTAVAPTKFVDAISDDYEIDAGLITDEDTTRSRQTHKVEAGPVTIDGGWDAPANPEGGFGLLLKAVLGAETVTEITTGESHEHVFTPADTLPSLTVQIDNDQTNIQYVGVPVDELELSHTSEERLTYSVTAPAAAPEPGASSMSPTYSSLRNFLFHDASLTLGGEDRAADLSELTITLSNNLSALHRDDRTVGKFELGPFGVEIEATLDFEHQEAFESVLGQSGASSVQDSLTPIGFEATWTSPSTIGNSSDQYLLTFDLPEVHVGTQGATIDGNAGVMEEVSITPRVDQSGSISDMLEVTLQNSVSSAY